MVIQHLIDVTYFSPFTLTSELHISLPRTWKKGKLRNMLITIDDWVKRLKAIIY